MLNKKIGQNNKIRNAKLRRNIFSSIIVIAVLILGLKLLTASHATGPYTTAEAESGILSQGTIPVTDTTASGKSYAKFPTSSGSSMYTLPPKTQSNGNPDEWYWEISPSQSGLSGLPSTSASYPAPGSANIWDTDLFLDAGSTGSNGIPNGTSPVVQAIHNAGHYSICYVEAGAQQTGFPDFSNFATTDYINGSSSTTTQMQGYANENWFDLRGFVNYSAGNSSSLTGAAPNIAAALDKRIAGCKSEGQDALEPDDLDGYTNKSQSGAAGGGWGLTQSDACGRL